MTRRSAADQTSARERYAAIRRCRHCDPVGWRLQPNGEPIDPAVRCTHSPPSSVRDITEPIHQPDLFSEPDR